MSVASVKGIDLAYDETGDGLAIVLLHGYPLNRTMWREQVAGLREQFRIITPDLRGHGETPVGEGSLTMERMAEDLAALLDELRIERAVVGGLSMGGYVALAFYRLFPERTRALILADTRAAPDTDEARRGRQRSAETALDEGMKTIAEQLMPKMLATETLERRPEVTARVRAMIEATRPTGAAAALGAMAARRDQTSLLARIDVPALLLVGASDVVTPPAEMEAMRASMRDARLLVIGGAGHLSNVEQPGQFNRALLSFLQQLDGQNS